jgi:hypothetical protein
MSKRYLLVLVVIILGVLAAYSSYSYYQPGRAPEPGSEASEPGTTTMPSTGSNTTAVQEPVNETNRSTVSIPLEKPPFIE